MDEDQNVEQGLEDGKSERPEEVNDASYQLPETSYQLPETSNRKPESEIENMEVHHHPKIEK